MLVLFGLAADIVIGLLVEPVLSVPPQPYLSTVIVAALDVILGGTRVWPEGTFSDRVFVISSLSNVFIAGLIVFVGDQVEVESQLSTGVVVTLEIRTSNSVVAIRRAMLHAQIDPETRC